MNRRYLLAAAAAGATALALAGCASTDEPAATSSESTSTPTVTKATDPTDYLAKVRANVTGGDDVPDSRLLSLGEAFCADLRGGKWDHTVIDDESKVGDLPVQMRINIGFAAVHSLCPEQEADYLSKAAAAFDPPQ